MEIPVLIREKEEDYIKKIKQKRRKKKI